MIVILVNESEGKAWLRTRRILSKFLPQIGSRSWAGHISNEGLADLRLALKKAVSKSGSVACHRVTGRNHLELQWIAGNQRFFDEVGRYCFRAESSKPTFDIPLAPGRRVLHLIVQLAALVHDIGKATVAFQAKLRGKYNAEHFRHDLMGYFMLSSVTEDFANDQEWLGALSSNARHVLNWPVEAVLKSPIGMTLDRLATKTKISKTPLLFSLLWLVLTHHRLPNGKVNIDFGSHQNSPKRASADNIQVAGKSDVRIASEKECLQLAPGVMPWQDDGWIQAVQSAAKQLLTLIQNSPDLGVRLDQQSDRWFLLMAHWARPCLIYADHLASIAKNAGGDIASAQGVQPLANTCEVDGEKPNFSKMLNRVAGDSLLVHLIKTKRFARRTLLVTSSPGELFRRATIPTSSMALAFSDDPRYQWQERIASCIKLKTQAIRPAFVGIIAGTGCGKTLGGVRAMHALSDGQMRYTLALGLRSLTMQSAKALIGSAGFERRDVAVAIGQPRAMQWLESEHSAGESSRASGNGSESGFSDEEGFHLRLLEGESLGTTDLGSLPAWVLALDLEGTNVAGSSAAELFCSSKHRAMIDTPILACTADHLVAAVEMRTGGSARMALRMMTSDLLLDEIDAYSAQDLQSIGKLAMLTGMAGRSVVVMSATANDIVIGGIYNAWAKGMEARRLMDGEQSDLGVVILADQESEPICLHKHSLSQVKEAHQLIVEQMKARDSPVRQRLEVLELEDLITLELTAEEKRAKIFEKLLEKSIVLHENNAGFDPRTGIQVSFGFVRFNHANHAWRFAKFLLERTDDINSPLLRTLSYHSKHPRVAIGLMDQKLNQLLLRHDLDAVWKDPDIRCAIEQAKAQGRRGVMVLISTTTLQETGRDHDYDWAILEPRSVRGEVQACGRIRRHRVGAWGKVNILLMSHPLRTIYGGKTSPHWGLPGVEESLQNQVFGIGLASKRQQRLSEKGALAEVSLTLSSLSTGNQVSSPPIPMPPSRGRPHRISSQEEALHGQQGPKSISASDVLPVKFWMKQGVSAVAALEGKSSESSSTIGHLERLAQHLHLLSTKASSELSDDKVMSLSQYLVSEDRLPSTLTNQHASAARFRQSLDTLEILVFPISSAEWEVRWFDEKGRSESYPTARPIGNETLKLDRLLFDLPTNVSKQLTKVSNSEPKRGTLEWQLASARIEKYGETLPKLRFNLALGFITGSE
jgi:CRISPR-associated endonuclease/helicase Cas3